MKSLRKRREDIGGRQMSNCIQNFRNDMVHKKKLYGFYINILIMYIYIYKHTEDILKLERYQTDICL